MKKFDLLLTGGVMLSQRLIATWRIPQRVTSDRNYTVSPGTNHSFKDSSYRPAGGSTPNLDFSSPPAWENPNWEPSFPAQDLLRVPASREPEPSTGSGAPVLDGGSALPKPPPTGFPAPGGARAARRPPPARPTPPPPLPAPWLSPAGEGGARPDAGRRPH